MMYKKLRFGLLPLPIVFAGKYQLKLVSFDAELYSIFNSNLFRTNPSQRMYSNKEHFYRNLLKAYYSMHK